MRGFTLLENVIVVSLIALLVGFSVPLYRGYMSDRALQNAAYLIQADLRFAQQAAVSRAGAGPRVEVCFLPSGYEIYAVDYLDSVARDPAQLGVGSILKVAGAGGAYRAGTTITVDPAATDACLRNVAQQALRFLGNGAPRFDNANDTVPKVATLALNGRVNRLTIYPETGRVIVCGAQPQC